MPRFVRLPLIPGALVAGVLQLLLAGAAPAQTNNCLPPSSHGTPATMADFEALHGSTLLIVYGTSGPKKGFITSGTIDLERAPADLRSRGTLLVGSSSLDLARVGGRLAGSIRSRDPGAPGVTLELPAQGKPATLTFGSVRTRDAKGALTVAVTRFDLSERTYKGIRGYWRVVGDNGPAAGGYFCASRF